MTRASPIPLKRAARWLVAAAAAGVVGQLAYAEVHGTALMYLRRSMYRAAYGQLAPALDAAPADDDLHAMMASTLARAGFHADALEAFEYGHASSWYGRGGIMDHADALRGTGRPGEAAELRVERIRQLDEGGRPTAYMAWLEDLTAARNWEALEAAEAEAMAMHPEFPGIHVALARAAIVRGDLDASTWHLWMAQHLGDTLALDYLFARLDHALVLGDVDRAHELFVQIKRTMRNRSGLGPWEARIHLLEGSPETALAALRDMNNQYHDDPQHHMLEAIALYRLGEQDEAHARLSEVAERYPQHWEVAQLLAQLEAEENE